MAFDGWRPEAFEAMATPGFAPRMQAIRQHVRPVLEAIAEALAPGLSSWVGEPLYPHVAQHARRTVNPPEDTWCAWSPSPRGYKKQPHFQLGIRADQVYVQAGAITEAPFRTRLADLLTARVGPLREALPPDAEWKDDHTAPSGTPTSALSAQDVAALAAGLRRKSRGDWMVALRWPKEQVLGIDPQRFLEQAQDALRRLVPVYRLVREAEKDHAAVGAARR